jgi:hypothetical protein
MYVGAQPLDASVHRSLATVVDDRDAGAVELARTYVREIAMGGDLAKLGPALLACLAALGLTPAARAALVKGGTGGSVPSPLDELKARRAKRSG